MTVNAPSGTSNFITETNFDYNTTTGWVTENNKRKVKLVENATISNYGTTATTQEYTFTGKYYNLDISQEQLANKSFTGIIYVSKKECVSKELFDFYLDDVQFYATKDMTWDDWVNSDYSDGWRYKNELKTYDELITEDVYSGSGYYPMDSKASSENKYLVKTGNFGATLILVDSNYNYNFGGPCDETFVDSRHFKFLIKNELIYDSLNNYNNVSNTYFIRCCNFSCLSPETLIDVEEEDKKGKKRRKRKMLKDIKLGDKVICVNPDTLKLDTDIVTECDNAFIKRHTCYDKWYFENNIVITTVHRHRFYNVENKTFMYMDEWNIGQHGIDIDGNKVKLIKHEHIEEEITHATLFTKKYNNYFANGMLSGNRHSKEINL